MGLEVRELPATATKKQREQLDSAPEAGVTGSSQAKVISQRKGSTKLRAVRGAPRRCFAGRFRCPLKRQQHREHKNNTDGRGNGGRVKPYSLYTAEAFRRCANNKT